MNKGENNSNWHGGKSHTNGYLIIRKPDHLRAHINGYVYDHILIAEKALGKPLPNEAVVHHHGDKKSKQLVICQDQAYHKLLHQRQRAYEACGHANWRKCKYCKEYDSPDNLTISYCANYHKECHAKHYRKYYQENTYTPNSTFTDEELNELIALLSDIKYELDLDLEVE